MTTKITLDSVVVASGDQVSCDLGGEAAILHLKAGIYYGLDPLGTRIWNLIREPQPVKRIQDTLLSEYEVDPEQCEDDLIAFLKKLLEADLAQIKK